MGREGTRARKPIDVNRFHKKKARQGYARVTARLQQGYGRVTPGFRQGFGRVPAGLRQGYDLKWDQKLIKILISTGVGGEGTRARKPIDFNGFHQKKAMI